ncbi:MAG: hypothetical protein ACOYI5_02230, partial [Christensenellales bacterium]
DAAGRRAALRALDILDAADVGARVIDYPAGMDPDDYIKEHGRAGFDALAKIEGVQYRMLRLKDDLDLTTQEGMTKYALQSCAIIRTVKNPVEAENHLRRLANETGYDRETLARQVGASAAQDVSTLRPRRRDADTVKTSRAEGALIALISAGLIPPETVSPDDFDAPVNARAAQWLLEGYTIGAFVAQLKDEERSQMMADLNAERLPESPDIALDMARDMLRAIRERRRQARIEQMKEKITIADESQKKELMAHLAELIAQMPD